MLERKSGSLPKLSVFDCPVAHVQNPSLAEVDALSRYTNFTLGHVRLGVRLNVEMLHLKVTAVIRAMDGSSLPALPELQDWRGI